MLESFTDATELLRHFYAMLNRANTTTSHAEKAAEKAKAILDRLSEYNGKNLEARKRVISEERYQNPDQKEAHLAVINGILLLIQRAKTSWNIFSCSK